LKEAWFFFKIKRVKLYLLCVTIVIAILIVAIPNVQHYYFLMGQRKTFNFPDVKALVLQISAFENKNKKSRRINITLICIFPY